MARIRFIGDSPGCAWLGVSFTNGQWIDDHGLDAADLARVKANATFEVDESEEIAAAAAVAAAKAKREAAAEAAAARAAAKAALAEEKAEADAAAAAAIAAPGNNGLKV